MAIAPLCAFQQGNTGMFSPFSSLFSLITEWSR